MILVTGEAFFLAHYPENFLSCLQNTIKMTIYVRSQAACQKSQAFPFTSVYREMGETSASERIFVVVRLVVPFWKSRSDSPVAVRS